MKNTSTLHFIPSFNASRFSFDDVMESVKQHMSDFLKKHYIDNDIISDFIVIEPSKASLEQGLQYLWSFYENSKTTVYVLDHPNKTTLAAMKEAETSDNLETLDMKSFRNFVDSL